MFTLPLLQAINDWQRGGDARAKHARGRALKAVAPALPLTFKQAGSPCFRRIALNPRYVWGLGTQLCLKETLSSWTDSFDGAKRFKGGVPPVGYQGIILAIQPGTGTVILNLPALFQDKDFVRAVNDSKSKITNYADGLGRYGNSEREIVIEVSHVPLASVFAYGGYSHSLANLAQKHFGRAPTASDLALFLNMLKQRGQTLGPRWLTTPSALQRVRRYFTSEAARLAKRQVRTN